MKTPFSLMFAIVTAVGVLAWAVTAEEGEEFVSMEGLIERYQVDRDALAQYYGRQVLSESHYERMKKFNEEWRAALERMDFEGMSQDGKVDYVLMRHQLEYRVKELQTDWGKLVEVGELMGFKDGVLELYEGYRRQDKLDPRVAAEELAAMEKAVAELKGKVSVKEEEGKVVTTAVLAQRAQKLVAEVQRRLEGWYRFYAGFDPEFSWWAEQPYGELREGMEGYVKRLGELASDGKEGEEAPLVGDPIGEEALANDIGLEMLAYSPEELLAIGQREFDWCRAEMVKAAGEMGFGDDWRKALEQVKADFVPPGEQDDLAKEIARDAIQFIDEKDLVTVPELCRETWYLTMLGKQEQETLPYAVYFGQAIGIAFPTDEMSVEKKLMSLRGNNRHFTRAVIPHELIPGHHLQRHMSQRYARYRGIFRTPFFVEGWALHWEMLLYDLEYARTPEERIGMLFWRAHRCARIIVSLKFHLGQMEPEEMVTFLKEQVGMEEFGARSEVRRYIGDSYSPLYQCGYMLGGLQLRAIYKETVGEGKMTAKQFHDAVLRLGPVPMEMVRASLLNGELARGYTSTWKF